MACHLPMKRHVNGFIHVLRTVGVRRKKQPHTANFKPARQCCHVSAAMWASLGKGSVSALRRCPTLQQRILNK